MKKDASCVYCGRPAVTLDHIPPKNIFPKALRHGTQLIKVPSCEECNHGASNDDEEFKLTVCLKAGQFGAGRRELMNDALRTTARNQKLYKRIADSELMRIENPDNPTQFIEYHSVSIDGAHIVRVCKRIVRGLHYYIFQEPLAYDAEIRINLIERLDLSKDGELLEILFENAEVKKVGNFGEFKYHVANPDKVHPEALIWKLTFHENFEVIALSLPAGFKAPPPRESSAEK